MSALGVKGISRETFYRWVLAAIILRIVLMPFFGHVDVLSEARRIFYWDQNGIYFDDISRNATALFQLFFFKIFSVFIENKEVLFFHEDMRNSTAHPFEYFEFVSQPTIFRTLFIIKIPFFVADMLSAYAIYQLSRAHFPQQNRRGAQRAVLFWLFNPITLFAFYIFGRFESIPVMFCLLSLLALQRQQLLLSAILMGLSVNSREIFIFMAPIYLALILSPAANNFAWPRRLIATVICVFAVAVATQMISLTGAEVDAFGRQVSSITAESRVDYLFQFIVGSYLMFPMAYLLLLLFIWNNKGELDRAALIGCVLFLLAFFAFSSHTAHYTSWLIGFVCIYYAGNERLLKPLLLLCLTWVLLNLSITDLGVFTTWLASPWSISFSGLPNFPRMYEAFGFTQILDLRTFQRICRTFYAACLWYLAAQIIWSQRSRLEIALRGQRG